MKVRRAANLARRVTNSALDYSLNFAAGLTPSLTCAGPAHKNFSFRGKFQSLFMRAQRLTNDLKNVLYPAIFPGSLEYFVLKT